MTWSIQIPYQSRDQTIADALASGVDRAIERGEDRDVVSMLLLQASEFRNMGALIDHVESLDADGRRQLLDRARKDAGLEASEDIDSRENFEWLNRNLRPGRDAEGKIFQGCHAPNCHAVPFDDQGRPVPVAASRWFCGKHEDQAQAGDLDPPDDLRPRLDFATMRLLPGRAEEERERRDWEARIAAINERDKAKRDQAERMRAIAEARRANMKPPVGFGPR